MIARRFAVAVLSLFILFVNSPIAFSQTDEDDEDSVSRFVQLNINVEANGNARIDYRYFEPIPDPDATRQALAQATGCPASSFTQRPAQTANIKDPARRAALEKRYTDFALAGMQSQCIGYAQAHGRLLHSASLDTAPILQLLKPAQVESLWVSFMYPDQGSRWHSDQYAQNLTRDHGPYATYVIPVKNATPAQLSVRWGYRSSDLAWMGATLAAFLVVPIAICYWVRFKALAMGGTDRTAAWFSYFRAVNLCGNGVFLFWMIAGNSSRRGMLSLLSILMGTHTNLAILATLALTILPPWIVYFICLSGSYKVLVQIRGIEWKRSEFLLVQFLTVSALLVPIAALVGFFQIWRTSFRAGIAVMIAGWILTIICARLKVKVSKTQAEPLSTGELRDRMFALAQRAGVTLKHVFVMPAGKMQVANAFAAANQVVTFTDYVLQRLSKREVDAVAGHELSHLRLNHPAKLTIALVFVIFLPAMVPLVFSVGIGVVTGIVMAATHNYRLLGKVIDFTTGMTQSPLTDPLILAVGLLGFYFLSRRFERAADEGAVQLTSDPEALITGLLKLNKLNLMPFQWSKSTGIFLTHPSTLKRIHRIAMVGNVPSERVEQLLAELSSHQAVPDPADYYLVPDSSNRVVTTADQVQKSQINLVLLLLGHIVPPTFFAWLALRTHFGMAYKPAILAGGAVLSLLLYILLGRSVGTRGRGMLRAKFEQKFRREGLLLDYEKARVVGFAPGPHPRFYVSNWNWDNGLLILRRGSLFFLGDQVRFRIPIETISRVWIGQGSPSFFPVKRVYMQTIDPVTGRSSWLNFSQLERCSPFALGRQSRKLFDAIAQWRNNQAAYSGPPDDLVKLSPPNIGEVTCQPPSRISTVNKEVSYVLLFALLSWASVVATGINAFAYVFGVVLLMRLYEFLPYRFYRDRSPDGKPIRSATSAADQVAVQLPTT